MRMDNPIKVIVPLAVAELRDRQHSLGAPQVVVVVVVVFKKMMLSRRMSRRYPRIVRSGVDAAREK
jgi:hypothetical protein